MRSSALFLGAAVVAMATALGAAPASAQFYDQHNLVSSESDADLVNAWGLTSGPTSPWWVADNGTGLSTLYNSAGTKITGIVAQVGGNPTGAVFNIGGANAFLLNKNTKTGRALFLFANEDGSIEGWNGSGTLDNTAQMIPASDDNVYKGLAIALFDGTHARLYATNFRTGKVDVFAEDFSLVQGSGFEDPTLPAGYAPFGIQVIGGMIFVTYAQQDDDAEDDVKGHGHGFVDAYDTAGTFLMRVATRDKLDSPWGLAMTPPDWGAFGSKLLVGNFGDGLINVFDPTVQNSDGTLEYLGFLHSASGPPLKIDGLWALQFAQGGQNGTPDQLFFTAGPDDENAGLFGFLTPAGSPGKNKH
jgi:uncharacterized protein (TIGR03118 family)